MCSVRLGVFFFRCVMIVAAGILLIDGQIMEELMGWVKTGLQIRTWKINQSALSHFYTHLQLIPSTLTKRGWFTVRSLHKLQWLLCLTINQSHTEPARWYNLQSSFKHTKTPSHKDLILPGSEYLKVMAFLLLLLLFDASIYWVMGMDGSEGLQGPGLA